MTKRKHVLLKKVYLMGRTCVLETVSPGESGNVACRGEDSRCQTLCEVPPLPLMKRTWLHKVKLDSTENSKNVLEIEIGK